MKEIIVLFKTHLDVGFTDFAQNVVDNYLTQYIPKAMEVAKELRGKEERFIWTVGSWLVDKYLKEGKNKEQLIEAIENGDIRWHGLPFTTHTELMNDELFKYGLSLSQKLDKQFGLTTIAAKMTDVPGHTRAIVPHMVNAGIKFLHIGVNPASTRPSVPDLFKWKASSGEELIVMYNNSYGELTQIGESGVWVYFAHTGDNHGPQSADQIIKLYNELREKYPDVALRAGTLEDVAEIAIKEKNLPVVTSEIGDTWIHGVGTDPKKVSGYRALLRLKDCLPKQDMECIYDGILPIPEHTWGLDEKTHLGKENQIFDNLKGEHDYFIRKDFEKMLDTPKFKKMEQSWSEQRNYIQKAVDSLPQKSRDIAKQAISETLRCPTDTSDFTQLLELDNIAVGGYTVGIDKTGAICSLKHNGTVLADNDHKLCNFLYEVFSLNEYKRFERQYVTSSENWAVEDFGKIGMDKAITEHQEFRPIITGVWQKANQLLIQMEMTGAPIELYGGAQKLETLLIFGNNNISVDFAWYNKKTNRIAEAFWLGYNPIGKLKAISKLGEWIDPCDVVENGNKRMHALDFGVEFDNLAIQTLDAPLVNIGKPSLLDFTNEKVSKTDGVHFNLFNNIWGTNFRMWYGEDARFRFMIKVKD